MKRFRSVLLVILAMELCLLAACQPRESVSEAPSEVVSETPGQTESQPVESSAPAQESESAAPSESQSAAPVFVVDGAEVPGEVYESPVGYTVFCPEEVMLNAWEGGDTFQPDGAEGTYLAVSKLDAPGMSTAVAALQFEYAIEGEPTGCLFGAKGYAGMKMTLTAEDLYMEFILCEEGGVIYLLELATYGEGAAQEPLLRAMLDTVEFG